MGQSMTMSPVTRNADSSSIFHAFRWFNQHNSSALLHLPYRMKNRSHICHIHGNHIHRNHATVHTDTPAPPTCTASSFPASLKTPHDPPLLPNIILTPASPLPHCPSLNSTNHTPRIQHSTSLISQHERLDLRITEYKHVR